MEKQENLLESDKFNLSDNPDIQIKQPELPSLIPPPVLQSLIPQPVLQSLIPPPILQSLTPQPILQSLTPQPVLQPVTQTIAQPVVQVIQSVPQTMQQKPKITIPLTKKVKFTNEDIEFVKIYNYDIPKHTIYLSIALFAVGIILWYITDSKKKNKKK